MSETSRKTTQSPRPGRSGGRALYEKHGAEHMRRMGSKGRATTREKYGLRFYSEIARRKRRDRYADAAGDTVAIDGG